MAVKIAVANQKGGVGKTTTSICMAQELKFRGKRVLFIDTDSQCNSTKFYEAQIKDAATFVDILCGDEPAADCIQETAKGFIIPSDPLLSDAETMVKVDERRFTHLKRSIRSVEKDFDYIIIDTPPSIGVALKNVLAMADYIVIPVEESGWALDGLMDLLMPSSLLRTTMKSFLLLASLLSRQRQIPKNPAEWQIWQVLLLKSWAPPDLKQ